MPLSVMRGERRPGSLWTDHDSLMAQALEFYEGALCSGCGQPMWDSMDPDSEGHWHGQDPDRCLACTAIEQKVPAYAEASQPRALKFTAVMDPRETWG